MPATSHLRSLQALELAVRTGSLKATADVLAITPAAVGQRVKLLEDYLGVDLLTRSRSGLKPTAALRAALPHLEAGFRELAAAAAMMELQRGQEIHIAATSDFAELWLNPRIGAFKASHTNAAFCINGEGEAPIRLGPVDCEISFGPARDGGELLFRDYVLPVTSPENAARIAGIAEAESLEGFPLLHMDFYKDDPSALGWPGWIRRWGFHRTAPERGIRFQRVAPVIEAVLADAGLAICGIALISERIEDGRLAIPFPTAMGAWTSHAFHARFRPDALARPPVKRFRDWLLGEARATAAWLQARYGPG